MKKHMDYFDKFGDEAVAWVIERAQNATSRIDKNKGNQSSNGSGTKEMLKKTISHPVANVFLALMILGAL